MKIGDTLAYLVSRMLEYGLKFGAILGMVYPLAIIAESAFYQAPASTAEIAAPPLGFDLMIFFYIYISFVCTVLGAVFGLLAVAVSGMVVGLLTDRVISSKASYYPHFAVILTVIVTLRVLYTVRQFSFFVLNGEISLNMLSLFAVVAAGYAGWRVAPSYAKLVQTEGTISGTMA
jgi:hypothetical protein